MRRRSFLKQTAAAGAVLGFPTIIPSRVLGADAPSNRIVMGAIGVGGMGTGDMRGMCGFKEVQMVAVCDVQKSARDSAKNWVDGRYGDSGCAAYNDFRELLAREDIDAVVIGTPDHWHAIQTITACRSGKDVYCEKPISLTVREGREMVTAARRYGRVVSGGSQRVLGDYGRLAHDIRSESYSGIKEIYVNVGGPSRHCNLPGQPVPGGFDWNMWLGPAPWAPYHPHRCGRGYGLGGTGFRSWYDYSGGMMTDWGAHKFAAAIFWAGVGDTGPAEVIPPDGKDHPYLTYVFEDGLLMYHSEGRGNVDFVHGGSRKIAAGPGPAERYPAMGYRGRGGIYGDFLHCVRTRERPFRDVELSHRAATVCHLGNIAYQLQRPLKWNPVKERFLDDELANRLLDRPKREPWTI